MSMTCGKAYDPVTFGSLFSGIGGLDLALEAFGHMPIWQAEKDPYARAVLAKHWPGVHCYEDVREIDAQSPAPDIICGGFPCQDISNAGKRAGIDGERSGLWSEFARIVGALRPRFVFVENVAALAIRGLDRVLGDLAALGFDAEWDVLGACCVGAPHQRERLFIVATNAAGKGLEGRAAAPETAWAEQRISASHYWWATEPTVPRVGNGIPNRVDVTRCLGNAVVPAQAALAWETLIRRATPHQEGAAEPQGGKP